MGDSFWAGGADELARALHEEFEEKMRSATNEGEKELLKDEVKRKLADVPDSLF